ncbi:MAG: 30S ribosome-binding factor RbfA [Desulfobacteraceae bacterium]|nr:30S ribosome-binding factor RbfA [Desulfobacteraceae bacterium]
MKPYGRAERVSGLIQQALSEILLKSIKDPRLAAVSITGVKMTGDLKLARIYFVTSGHFSSREDAAAGFRKAHGFIKNSLARELELRYMPDLEFFYDESIDYGMHIDSVLKRLHNEHEPDHPKTKEE